MRPRIAPMIAKNSCVRSNLVTNFVRELKSRNLSHCESILQATNEIEAWSDYEKAKLLSLQGRLEIGQAQYNLALQRFSSAVDLIREETDTENLRIELIIYEDEANRLVHKTSGIQQKSVMNIQQKYAKK
jgi:hypothetical protein